MDLVVGDERENARGTCGGHEPPWKMNERTRDKSCHLPAWKRGVPRGWQVWHSAHLNGLGGVWRCSSWNIKCRQSLRLSPSSRLRRSERPVERPRLATGAPSRLYLSAQEVRLIGNSNAQYNIISRRKNRLYSYTTWKRQWAQNDRIRNAYVAH